jgi:hypothetical protein
MSTAQAPVSDMLVTVKSREIQRGMLAEMRGDTTAASRHFLAAAHLELVLSNEYAEAGEKDIAIRSRVSAASCLWRGGQKEQAQSTIDSLSLDYPDQIAHFESVLADLKGMPSRN